MGLPQEALEGFAAYYKGATPLARLGTPKEIAPAVVFLASDEAAYVSAHDMLVDGGWASV
jgi:NAD(P)-dependent dehydrogenase (short-subunit alcohol dehydrogenase family)